MSDGPQALDAPLAFDAIIVGARGGGALVEIPFDVSEVYGTRGRVRVRATFDGHEYRGSIAPMGSGVHVLGLRKDVRAAIDKDIGDTVTVTLEEDTEPRTVEIPPELQRGLAEDDEARRRYEGLSYTHRREFAGWIAEARKQETRDRRAAKAVAMLRSGETR
jgi:hypothetical protein